MTLDRNRYSSLENKPYESHYLLIETVIDQPVEKVWPHALDIGSWMTDHRFETLAGEPGEVGRFERVYSCGVDPKVPQPHYHLYGIAHVIPRKLIALEVFPENGGSYGNSREWVAFDNILFIEMSGRTRLVFLQADVHHGQAREADPVVQANRKRDEDILRERITRYFENLRRLAGSSAAVTTQLPSHERI